MRYSVKEAVDGGFVVMCRGVEFATAQTVDEAAMKCALDVLELPDDAMPDFVYDVAVESGNKFGNVRHMSWFKQELADEIASYWPEFTASPAPGM